MRRARERSERGLVISQQTERPSVGHFLLRANKLVYKAIIELLVLLHGTAIN